ncbi:RelA/SpoT family protein [Acidipropionibacterium timonense]|uniref:RelA/SpoT family protein n=1 Tax=Acidipropionibacterium timonense TaxID=2161818 RepID=UPI001030F833|nr:bifunctional (p)ppGpp synthetase/guanosine-3',5'-bis(diphosphate) 3'-pyrophosphohydrolase [Acidipropionibacterium timonense]
MADESVYGPYRADRASLGTSESPTPAPQPRMRMRERIVRWGAPKQPPTQGVLDPLMSVVLASHPKADVALLQRAYETADHYHRGQTRKSGDPYITHPLAVAMILAELGMDDQTLCAGLLHDTVEDTSYTMEQLTADFGEQVALLVDGVTKLDKVQYGDSAKAETIRKMVIAMSRDIRVLVIKLADRLHNMRTLGFLRPDKQNRIAKETLEIFAPLAHRLGMNAIKWELEDLAFSTMQPKVYDEIVHLVAEQAPRREEQLKEVISTVRKDLADAGIAATVYGRPKHYYSIYQKMVVRGRDFSDIYDLVGLRILVDTPRDCYAALGVMHVRWNPLPGRFKDYIAMPKYNMYQSLHTTVLGPGGHPVELQIRTHEMHRRAEYGVAAHWKYKENPNAVGKGVQADGSDLSWVYNLNQWSKEEDDPSEFLDSLRFEINSREVYVFTPKGDVIALPQDSTPVDFAYAVHTEVGHHCIGARVNGKLVPLDSKLSNGDVVGVLTSNAPDAGPSRDWLGFVASPRARSKIKAHFTRERREESIESGKDAIARQIRHAGLPMQTLLTVEYLTAVADDLRVPDINSLYAAVGEHNVSAQAVVDRLIALGGGAEEAAAEAEEDLPVAVQPPPRRRSALGVEVDGDPNMLVKLARCCTPMPGDDIMGFVTRADGVSVHRTDCSNAKHLLQYPERIVPVSWSGAPQEGYVVTVQVEGLDRAGLLLDTGKVLADQGISLISATMNAGKNHLARLRLTFESPDPTHLKHLIESIRRISGVYDVFRVKA